MPFDCDSVTGKITRSLMSGACSKTNSTSSPIGPAVRCVMLGLVASRAVGSTVMPPSAAMAPVRNVSDDTCPSPTARRLRMKRRLPLGIPDWSGCGTMLGLNSAEASKEYSCRK